MITIYIDTEALRCSCCGDYPGNQFAIIHPAGFGGEFHVPAEGEDDDSIVICDCCHCGLHDNYQYLLERRRAPEPTNVPFPSAKEMAQSATRKIRRQQA